MSRPAPTRHEKSSDAPKTRRGKEASSWDSEGTVEDDSGSAAMSGLALGSGPAPKLGSRSGGSAMIADMRSRREGSAASEATGSGGPALSEAAGIAAAVGADRTRFDELVGSIVEATVVKAGQSEDETVQAMAVSLDERCRALGAGLPEARGALEKTVTGLLSYRAAVEREAAEVARLQESDLGATVRFGTEITFSDPKLHGLFVDPEEKCDKKALQKSQAAATTYLQEWSQQVVRQFPNKKGFTLQTSPASPHTLEGATRFTFSMQVRDGGGTPSTLTWWYQTNVDNCCLELQMAPTTLQDFRGGPVSKWANNIFEVAGQLGLQSGAAGMGGGHLSMDRTSTFGDSAVIFSRVIQIYNHRARAGGIHSTYLDDDAPFIRDMDAKGGGKLAGEYDALMKRVDASILDPDSAMSVKDVRDQLWELLKKAKPLKEKLNNAGRYTALNIEPATEEDTAKQRVEFRRFQGQTGLDELCGQLEELLGLVESARRPG